MLTNEELAKKMQEVCRKYGVSQTELAEMSNLTKSQISLLWHSKIPNITSKTFFKVSNALKSIENKGLNNNV